MGDGCQHQPMCACANEVERLRSALEAAEREREEFRDLYNAAWNRASLAEATVERLTQERDRMLDEAAKSERRVCIERDAARAEVERLTRERDEAQESLANLRAATQGWGHYEDAMHALAAARAEAGALLTQKDGAYQERDRLVALVAAMAQAAGMRVGLGRHVGEPWDEDWRTIVFVDLPTGQASWHIHDSEVSMFYWLPTYPGIWDGHTTEEKYQRCEAAARALAAGGGKHGG